MVYARKINNNVLTFQVSGMLWKRSLVMQDIETGSLWSHILGKCMRGKLKGTTLKLLPSVMTTWEDWKEQHPDTTVLSLPRTSSAFKSSFYRKPEDFVFGIVYEGQARAYSFKILFKKKILEDKIAGEPILVTFDQKTTRAAIFLRTVKGKSLSFIKTFEGKKLFLTDKETKSLWNPQTGKAIKGPLKGTQLFVLPGIVSYSRAWKIFHPENF